MKPKVLVTGGAGYIGSHACKVLSREGFEPVTYDNLVTGWEDAVRFGPFEKGCLLDSERLTQVVRKHSPKAVMHFAALSNVGEASKLPELYWKNNFIGSYNLMEVMRLENINNLIFSSSCAIFGNHDNVVLQEDTDMRPLNAYGASKLSVENMLRDMSAASDLSYIALRYFNVAGCDPEEEIGEHHRPETHIVPIALEAALGQRSNLTVFGNDYSTPDGTCVRDYIHVADLVDAHIAALRYLFDGGKSTALNLGTTNGFSVMEIIESVQKVTGQTLDVKVGPRRAGDAAKLVSGSTRAHEVLNWVPRRSQIDLMVSSAYEWAQKGDVYKR